MNKGYLEEKIDFISFESVPKYFHFISIGKCEIKANIISEEITFMLRGNHTDMPHKDLNCWVLPWINKDGLWCYLWNLIFKV